MGSFFCLLVCGLSSAGELAKVPIDPCNITASPWDIGSPDLVVDGSVDTLMRSANVNPAYVQFKLDADVGVKALRACLGQIGFAWAEADTWWVEAADTPSDLEAKGGTLPFGGRTALGCGWAVG